VVRMIRKAIDEYEPLAGRDIKIIPQGSYRNNTNVRQESDVDMAVCCMEPFFASYQFTNYSMQETGNVDSSYTFAEFKNQVGAGLVKEFGGAGVRREREHDHLWSRACALLTASWPPHIQRINLLIAGVARKDRRAVGRDTDLSTPIIHYAVKVF